MAPRPSQAQRRNPQSSQVDHVYDLGVRGRKTGVMLEDTGERDEYGMEPVDSLFSSPDKNATRARNFLSDSEQDMDIDEASTLGPATVARMRRDRLSIPKARSPGKTFLNSPARHNKHMARTSSPVRGSVIEEEERPSPSKNAKRRLDFSTDPKMKPAPTNGRPLTNGSSQSAKTASQTSRSQSQTSKPSRYDGYTDEDPELSDIDDAILSKHIPKPAAPVEEEEEEEDDDSLEFLNAGGDEDMPEPEEPSIEEPEDEPEPEPEEEEEEPEEPAPVEKPQPKKRGRKPKAASPPPMKSPEPEPEPESESEPEVPEPQEEPAKKKRGRPGKRPSAADDGPEKPAKRPRGRPSLNKKNDSPPLAETSANAEARGTKKQKAAPVAKESKAESSKTDAAKGKPGRKRKSSNVGAESPPVPRRPPMPKRRSLVSQRRDNLEVKTTRSGRVSTKPLEFWRGERYDYDDEEDVVLEDKQGRRIKVGPKIKGVVRVEYDEEDKPKRRRGRPASTARPGRSKRRVSEVEEEDEREEWEDEPGRIVGECIYWYPDYELNPPQDDDQVEVAEEELAISQGAIQMKDIKDASFRFAKTLTMPFFGSGIVDLPPHSEKRMKNARKMQMVFFVHYGNVEVTVASSTFRITKGGTWFVPRGNHYSIVNDTDKPARLFFCQGCEMAPPSLESQEM